MNVMPYPKPQGKKTLIKSVVLPKKKKAKKKITSICVDCGSWWRGGKEFEEHGIDCRNELPVIIKNVRKTERQMYQEALDYLMREITKWRDGVRCVIHGDACGQYSEWGHVIPQGSCSYLVYSLSNSFRQSNTCNQVHRFVQAPYYDWYKFKFGNLAYKMLVDAWRNAPKGGQSTQTLIELLPEYVELYNNRFSMSCASIPELVKAGYYGEIIQEAWTKDGKI